METEYGPGSPERVQTWKGKKKMAKPNKNAPLGEGGRFAAVEASAAASGARNPAAVAAAAGRKKYGKAKFQRLSSAGRQAAP